VELSEGGDTREEKSGMCILLVIVVVIVFALFLFISVVKYSAIAVPESEPSLRV
jgi:hypothetical protein